MNRSTKFQLRPVTAATDEISQLVLDDGERWLESVITPPVKVAIVGSGTDTVPVINMMKQLHWLVQIVEPRPQNRHRHYFRGVEFFACGLDEYIQSEGEPDAVVIMSHSLSVDAHSLNVMKDHRCLYLGLLGPVSRTQRLLAETGINPSEMHQPLYSPIGLELGGRTQEEVALSIVAQMQSVLHGRSGHSLFQLSTTELKKGMKPCHA